MADVLPAHVLPYWYKHSTSATSMAAWPTSYTGTCVPFRYVLQVLHVRGGRQDRLRHRSMVLHVHRWCVLILCARTRFLGRDVSGQWCVTVVAKRRVFAVVAKSASSSAHPFPQKPQQAFTLHRDPMRRGNPPPRARMRAKGSALGLRAPGSNPSYTTFAYSTRAASPNAGHRLRAVVGACAPRGLPIMFGAEDVCGCDEAEGQGRGAMPTNIIA